VSIEQSAECFGEVADWIDVAHPAVGDQAGEEGILPCQGDLSDLDLSRFRAAVLENFGRAPNQARADWA